MHYHGFESVDPEWEWLPDLLRLRACMERSFLHALRSNVDGGDDVPAAPAGLLVEPVRGTGVSHFLRDGGTWPQLREFFVHRSIYHLKEADPHARVIPRLYGQAKASVVAVEFDEYGGGRAEGAHEQVMRRDVVGDLLAREPELARDVVFGVQATELLESHLSRHLLTAWQANTTSLIAS